MRGSWAKGPLEGVSKGCGPRSKGGLSCGQAVNGGGLATEMTEGLKCSPVKSSGVAEEWQSICFVVLEHYM